MQRALTKSPAFTACHSLAIAYFKPFISYYLRNELLSSVTDRQTGRQTESGIYEPTVQYARVGS